MLARKPLTALPTGLSAALAQYRADVLAIIEVCQARRQPLLFLTQPTLYRADLPPDLASLLWEYNDEGAYTPAVLAQVMAAYNDTLKAICQERGVDCFDLAAHLPRDATVFYDDCHFNSAGSQHIAELLTEFFARRSSGAPLR